MADEARTAIASLSSPQLVRNSSALYERMALDYHPFFLTFT